MNICKQYYQRVWDIEASKWDLEKSVELNDYKVTVAVLPFAFGPNPTCWINV